MACRHYPDTNEKEYQSPFELKDFWPKNPKAVACYRAFYSMEQWLEQIIFFAESLFKKKDQEQESEGGLQSSVKN